MYPAKKNAGCPPRTAGSGPFGARPVVNGRVWTGKDKRLMPVVAANEVRRGTVLAADLDDLGRLIRRAHGPAVYVQPVTNLCLHDPLHSRVALSIHSPSLERKRLNYADSGKSWSPRSAFA